MKFVVEEKRRKEPLEAIERRSTSYGLRRGSYV